METTLGGPVMIIRESARAPDFLVPRSWCTRTKQFTLPEAPQVHIVVPHPHDVVIAKVERLVPIRRLGAGGPEMSRDAGDGVSLYWTYGTASVRSDEAAEVSAPAPS